MLIVTLYADADFKGDYIEVYGDEGPCDVLGYGLPDLEVENIYLGISSYTTENDCSGQVIYSATNYNNLCRYTYGYATDYLGVFCNDNVEAMKLYRYY